METQRVLQQHGAEEPERSATTTLKYCALWHNKMNAERNYEFGTGHD